VRSASFIVAVILARTRSVFRGWNDAGVDALELPVMPMSASLVVHDLS
jgi:hypothetical protein